jgi:hypothetical protein
MLSLLSILDFLKIYKFDNFFVKGSLDSSELVA